MCILNISFIVLHFAFFMLMKKQILCHYMYLRPLCNYFVTIINVFIC